jgi:hypothetical protein
VVGVRNLLRYHLLDRKRGKVGALAYLCQHATVP